MAKVTLDSYESKVKRLEKIISILQDEELDLSHSLEIYEEGIRLYRECKEYLDDTKEKIKILEERV